MGRLFGLGVVILGIWAAAEIHTRGFDRAFGGLLAVPESNQSAGTAARRAGDAFQRAYDTSERRVDRMLERQE